MTRVLKEEWTETRSLKGWDPKQDFGPALLHAERLTILLADIATVKELQEQTKRCPERAACPSAISIGPSRGARIVTIGLRQPEIDCCGA